MDYKFDLERVKRAKYALEKYFPSVPKGKQPRDIWKDPISLVPNSGYRNKIFSVESGIVDLHGTVEKAFKSLMDYAEENSDIEVKDRFMTIDEIEWWAEYMKKEFEHFSDEKFPLLTYMDFIIGYYVVAAFRGFSAEFEFAKWVDEKLGEGKCYDETNIPKELLDKLACKDHDELDRKWMIDLLTSNNCAIQIKNRSFLLGGGFESFEKDYRELKAAASKLQKEHGIRYFFAFYDNDGGWVRKRKDGRFIFDSSEVFDLFDKNDIRKRKYIVKSKFESGEFLISDLTK